MLQGIQPVEREVCYLVSRSVDPEDAASLSWRIRVGVGMIGGHVPHSLTPRRSAGGPSSTPDQVDGRRETERTG